MLYVIRFENYLEEVDISNFEDAKEAQTFAEKHCENPRATAYILSGPNSLFMDPKWRRDVFNLLSKEKVDEHVEVGREELWERIEAWMQEPSEEETVH